MKDATKRERAVQKSGSRDALDPKMDDVTPIVEFLANFQKLKDPRAQHPSKQISIKIPEPLLAAFRFKADQAGVPYQTMIKQLMERWLTLGA
jgi:predicted DNA binding CopG/RHH family protein